jgi:ADP-heptose:LPS heptosyltransferase
VLFVIAQPAESARDTERIIEKYGSNIFNCSPDMSSFEDYIAAIANCDAVVSTDSAACHLAEALGKPSLTIFGPIRDDLRLRYYNRAYAIRAEYSGKTCRSPCGLSKSDNGCTESRLQRSPYSPCLLSISEERIYQRFKEFRYEALRNSPGNQQKKPGMIQ